MPEPRIIRNKARAEEFMCIGGPWCGEMHGLFNHERSFIVKGEITNGKQEWGRYYRVPRNYVLASVTMPGMYKDVLLWKDEKMVSPHELRHEDGTSMAGDPE